MSQAVLKVEKAKRYKAKASIMIQGLSGLGKTGLALAIAKELSEKWEAVGMVDTENRSALLYPGLTLHTGEQVPNDSMPYIALDKDTTYAPTIYAQARDMLIKEGATTVIFDSTTHAWTREGGVLDRVSKAKAADSYMDNYRVWGMADVASEKNEIFELIRSNKAHIITTVRVKEKFAMVLGDNGKNKVESQGEQQLQQEGLKYECDLGLEMVKAGTATKAPIVKVFKSRYPMFVEGETVEMTTSLIQQIRQYLEEGASVEDLEKQRHKDYINAVIDYCKKKPTQKNVWDIIKAQEGFENTKIDEIPLDKLKMMYSQLTAGE